MAQLAEHLPCLAFLQLAEMVAWDLQTVLQAEQEEQVREVLKILAEVMVPML